jgi:hypothetical protein
MKRSPAALALGLVGLTLIASWCTLGPRGERVVAALLDDISAATELPSEYRVMTVELDGEARRALVADEAERTTWPVTVPERAWLRVSFGMLPEAATIEGDGALFLIGAWDQVTFDELVSLVVNPYGNPDDRGWHDLAIDLSKYAGQTLELRFILRPRDSTTGDSPAWGDPRLVVR